MIWVIIASVWYFVGMICFYHIADWQIEGWVNGYYFWDKGKDLLFAGAITFNVPVYGKQFKTIFYFCIIRLAWEVAALTMNSDINNSMVINILFLLFPLIWVWQLLKEWWK